MILPSAMRSSFQLLLRALCVRAGPAWRPPVPTDGARAAPSRSCTGGTGAGRRRRSARCSPRSRRQVPEVAIVDGSVDGGSVEARAAIANRMSRGIPPDTFQANGGWGLMAWVLYNGAERPPEQDGSDRRRRGATGCTGSPTTVLASVSYGLTPDAPTSTACRSTSTASTRSSTTRRCSREIDIDPEEDLTDLAGTVHRGRKIKQFSQRRAGRSRPSRSATATSRPGRWRWCSSRTCWSAARMAAGR